MEDDNSYNQNNKKNIVREDSESYVPIEKSEEARIREAINKTDTEKFMLFTRMMRIGLMLKNAKITHHPH